MATCVGCGLPIPFGQGSSCSMCYGDIDHGSDGYYREYMERAQREQLNEQTQEQERDTDEQ